MVNTLQDRLDALNTMNPNTMEILREYVFDQNLAPLGLAQMKEQELVKMLGDLAKDENAPRFTERMAEVLRAGITNALTEEVFVYMCTDGQEVKTTRIISGNKEYVIEYTEDQSFNVVTKVNQWAHDPKEPFTWLDAKAIVKRLPSKV